MTGLMCSAAARPPSRAAARGFLAAIGDANDPITWSGIPYHFLQAARTAGLLEEGLPLSTDTRAWRVRRRLWNALRVASGDRYGGYQYSTSFLEALWAPHRQRLRGAFVVNCFQLYPPSVVADPSVEKWYFLDQTLLQLFDHYGQRRTVGRRIARQAVERERAGYQAAAGIIVHSGWAAASVTEQYGVPEERVHVILPGANLDLAAYARWEREELARRETQPTDPAGDAPVQLVFVGKDWQRKGLDRLLEGFDLARRRGCEARLHVVGCPRPAVPAALQAVGDVTWWGFVDKRTEAERFLRLVAACDVGCLLSRAEAGGIALREYHALGLAVLGTRAGGSPEHACAEASWLIAPDADAEAVADALRRITTERHDLARAKAAAWACRDSFLYPATVRRIQDVMPAPRLPTGPKAATPEGMAAYGRPE